MKISQFPITPIVTLVIGKIVGIMFTSIVFSIGVKLSNITSLFDIYAITKDNENLILLSSYSDLFMFTALSTGLVLSLLLYINKAHLNLNKNDLEMYFNKGVKNYIRTAYKLYGQSLNWLIIILFSNFYILYNTLIGRTYLWIYLVSLALTISLLLYFFYDLRKEIELSKSKIFKNEQ